MARKTKSRKSIREFFAFIGLVILLSGIFLCTWEAGNMGDQLTIYLYGAVFIVAGFALCLLNGGGENELE